MSVESSRQTVEEARIFEFFYAYGAQPGPMGECAEDGCENDAWVSVRAAPRRYVCMAHYQDGFEEAVRADARGDLEALAAVARGVVDNLSDLDHRVLGYDGLGAVLALRAAIGEPSSVEEAVCPRCGGTGEIVYGDTGLGRGGFAGQQLTAGPCPECQKARLRDTDREAAEHALAASVEEDEANGR